MNQGCKITLVHVSGERMKWQGSDGLSRGNLLEGVMKGEEMLSYVSLGKTALEMSSSLERWIRSWGSNLGKDKTEMELLTADDWFIRGHDIKGGVLKNGLYYPSYTSGIYLWSPAPSVAEIACEEIRKARAKRSNSTHIFVCPRLLTPYWRSHLHRSADVIFEIPAGGEYWPSHMYEPLILAIYFPLLPHRPWQLRQSPAILELVDRMQRMWRLGDYTQGPILRKLWEQTEHMGSMSERMVFKMLHCFGELKVPCEGGKKRDRNSLEKKEG